MKKLALIILGTVLFVGGLIWLALPPKEPSYKGETLTEWLTRYQESGGNPSDPKDIHGAESREAIAHIGTNAISTLIRILKAKDSKLKLKAMDVVERQSIVHFHFSDAEEKKQLAGIGFILLGDLATNAVTAMIDIYNHPSSPGSKGVVDECLMALYPNPLVATANWIPPDKRAAWYGGAAEMRKGSDDPSNAIIAWTEAIKLDPTNGSYYISRANVKFSVQDFNGALSDTDKALEYFPSNGFVLEIKGLCEISLKDFKAAEADFTRSLTTRTNNYYDINYRGMARMYLRKFDDALDDFNKSIELVPEYGDSYRYRGTIEGLRHDYELALADESKAIELNKHDAAAYVLRGRVKNGLKDYEAAIVDMNEAIRLNPKDSTAFASRATSYMCLDDYDRATADLDTAFQLNPKNATTFAVRGVLGAKRGGEDDLALANLQQVVELAPQSPESYGILGMFQYKIFKRDEALENFHKALQMGEIASASDYYSYIWLIHAQAGHPEIGDAESSAYLKSLDAKKTNEWSAVTTRFLIGSISESDFLEQAATCAKRPSAVKSQVCESLYYAGMKRKLADDKAGAMELFQKCLDTKNDNTFAYMNAGVELKTMKSQ